MTTIKGAFRSLAVFTAFAALVSVAYAQSALQFTAIRATDEGAIHLEWTSQPNEIYQIQCANALNTNDDGTTAWQVLYDNYPSQGTNTFWLDTGNYNLVPQVLHPKTMAMRFYRVVDAGPDTTSDEPWLSITSPANGTAATGELTITVTAGTDQPALSAVKLYVDGQEMQNADDISGYTDPTGVTNYATATFNINTCEWGNGAHVLFATAECQSGYGDAVNSGPIATGHGVSALVPVTFSNLITRISFSEPQFDPDSGQTQRVSAVFAANCNWTLAITDIGSNVVRTATGSGSSMAFNWDGNDNGGASLPGGVYYYYINAQTNGQPYQMMGGGSDGDGGANPPSSMLSAASLDAPTELYAMPADGSGAAAPLALYPPGYDTNGMTIFSMSPAEFIGMRLASRAASLSVADSGSPIAYDASGGGSSAASQGSPAAPQRPPANPVRGLAGTFGVCYDTFNGNGTNGINIGPLDNGLHTHLYISMDNFSATSTLHYAPTPGYTAEANNFVSGMKSFGWNNTLLKFDSTLSINDLKGSGASINNVNLGVFMSHSAYGTGQNGIDFAANQCLQMYYPVTSGAGGQYLRLSEMNLGGSGTNGLKWMAIIGCESLQHNNWANMQNKGVKPYNNNLHLLLGVDTEQTTNPNLLWYWSRYMNYGTSTNYSPLTIHDAWYAAARKAFSTTRPAYTIKYVVAGDSACFVDLVRTNQTPQGTWRIDSPVQVYP